MQPIESFKPLAVEAFILAWSIMLLLIIKWPRDLKNSFSKHAAMSRKTYAMMGLMQTIILPALFVFAVKWFAPTFHLSNLFILCLAIVSAGFLVAAWIPDVGGLKSKIHQFCAYSAALFCTPTVLFIAFSPAVSPFARIYSFVAVIYMYIAAVIFYKTKKLLSYYLYFQGAYILLFDLAILTVTYVR